AVLQEEEDEDDDEEDRGDAFDRRREVAVAVAEVGLLDDADLERLLRRLRGLRDALQGPLEALEDRQAAGAAPQEAHPLLDAVQRRALGELLRHGVELLVDPPAAETEAGHGDAEGEDDRAGPADEG